MLQRKLKGNILINFKDIVCPYDMVFLNSVIRNKLIAKEYLNITEPITEVQFHLLRHHSVFNMMLKPEYREDKEIRTYLLIIYLNFLAANPFKFASELWNQLINVGKVHEENFVEKVYIYSYVPSEYSDILEMQQKLLEEIVHGDRKFVFVPIHSMDTLNVALTEGQIDYSLLIESDIRNIYTILDGDEIACDKEILLLNTPENVINNTLNTIMGMGNTTLKYISLS